MQRSFSHFGTHGLSSGGRCEAIALNHLAALVTTLVLYCRGCTARPYAERSTKQTVALLLTKLRLGRWWFAVPVNAPTGRRWSLSLINGLDDMVQSYFATFLLCPLTQSLHRSPRLCISATCHSLTGPSRRVLGANKMQRQLSSVATFKF